MSLSALLCLTATCLSTTTADNIGDYADDFELVLTLQNPSGGDVDIGADAFNEMFRLSEHHILKRECDGCGSDHQVIYYKRRHGTFAFFDLYSNTYDWSSTYNTLGNEFNLYSTLDDALAGTNAWTYCNYDDSGIGMFRDCGPDGHVAHEWTSRERGGDAARFYIYTPGTGALSMRGERYGFVKTGVCEDYGMDSIHDAADCENAAATFGDAAGIDSEHAFIDRTDTWGSHWGRPTGCSWHELGGVEQWPTAAQDTCDSWGYNGCFCTVRTASLAAGRRFRIFNGSLAEIAAQGQAPGTTVVVLDLSSRWAVAALALSVALLALALYRSAGWTCGSVQARKRRVVQYADSA